MREEDRASNSSGRPRNMGTSSVLGLLLAAGLSVGSGPGTYPGEAARQGESKALPPEFRERPKEFEEALGVRGMAAMMVEKVEQGSIADIKGLSRGDSSWDSTATGCGLSASGGRSSRSCAKRPSGIRRPSMSSSTIPSTNPIPLRQRRYPWPSRVI